MPNFSKVAEPLTRLMRKNQIWIWGAEQLRAFEELKRLLTTAPIPIHADFSRPFILRTDASDYALGAVLLQGDGNQERPIEYASRLLNAAERNYSTTEQEVLVKSHLLSKRSKDLTAKFFPRRDSPYIIAQKICRPTCTTAITEQSEVILRK